MGAVPKSSVDPESPGNRRDPKRDARLIGSGIVGVLLVWFALVNLRSVPIEFWVSKSHAPLILVIAVSSLFGGLLTALAMHRKSPKD